MSDADKEGPDKDIRKKLKEKIDAVDMCMNVSMVDQDGYEKWLFIKRRLEVAEAIIAAPLQIWVLTREINDYNQDGAYFKKAWNKKPSVGQLLECGLSEKQAAHCDDYGGGRIDDEQEWFTLEIAP